MAAGVASLGRLTHSFVYNVWLDLSLKGQRFARLLFCNIFIS